MSQTVVPWVPALPDVTKFGTRLTMTRLALGWSQTEMAAELGVDNTSLSRWESGSNRPRELLELVSRVHAVTGVHRDWLLWGDVGGDTPDVRSLATDRYYDTLLVAA